MLAENTVHFNFPLENVRLVGGITGGDLKDKRSRKKDNEEITTMVL